MTENGMKGKKKGEYVEKEQEKNIEQRSTLNRGRMIRGKRRIFLI